MAYILKPWGHLAWNKALAVQPFHFVRRSFLLFAQAGLKWVLVSSDRVQIGTQAQAEASKHRPCCGRDRAARSLGQPLLHPVVGHHNALALFCLVTLGSLHTSGSYDLGSSVFAAHLDSFFAAPKPGFQPEGFVAC